MLTSSLNLSARDSNSYKGILYKKENISDFAILIFNNYWKYVVLTFYFIKFPYSFIRKRARAQIWAKILARLKPQLRVKKDFKL